MTIQKCASTEKIKLIVVAVKYEIGRSGCKDNVIELLTVSGWHHWDLQSMDKNDGVPTTMQMLEIPCDNKKPPLRLVQNMLVKAAMVTMDLHV